MADYRDERDNPGIRVPPPLIYLLLLLVGLLLDRRHTSPFHRAPLRAMCGPERARW